MENQKKKQTQKGNIKYIRQDRDNNYCRLSTYHLQDNRLTTTEQLIFTKLLILPPNFKLSIRKTAYYVNVNHNTFEKALKTFKKYGYIKTEKINQNEVNYIINEISDTMSEFNIYYLKNYSDSQLNYFIKNKSTPTKYKKVIKMYIEKTQEYERFITELIDEKDKELF